MTDTSPAPDCPGVEIHGPFREEWRVTLNDYRVPLVHVREQSDGSVEVVIDHRFTLEHAVSREEFDRWIPLLANAMAIAAGYSCHGENCQPINPFKVRMRSLGSVSSAPNLTVIDGGAPSTE